MNQLRPSASRFKKSFVAIALTLGSALPAIAQGQSSTDVTSSAVETTQQATTDGNSPDLTQVGLPRSAALTSTDASAATAERPMASAFMVSSPAETMEERLNRVTYGLRIASTAKCANPEMMTGLSFFDLANHDRRQRPALEQRFGISKGFGVRLVVPNSSASVSGLVPGDVITAVNGIVLANFRNDLIGNKATYARIAQFETFLDKILQQGPAVITIQRGGNSLQKQLTGVAACGGSPVFYPRGGLNAWADGLKFAVTARMMQFAASDNELAFVIAHEMAHNILEHARRLKGQSGLLSKIGFGSGKVKEAEIEADQMGVRILLDAGYALEGALSTLTRVRGKRPFDLAQTHPGISRRMQIVLASAEQWSEARKALVQQASVENVPANGVQIAGRDQTPASAAAQEKPVIIGSSQVGIFPSSVQNGIDDKPANLSILWGTNPVGDSAAFL